MVQKGWQVHKFGGSSLADPDCFRRVGEILLQGQGLGQDKDSRRAVVVSAMGGMTDALLDLVQAAEGSADDISAGLQAISSRYEAAVRELIESPDMVESLLELFNADLDDASDVLHAVSLVRSAAADRSRDLVAGFGELWSARLLAGYLENRSDSEGFGQDVKWVDARDLLVVEQVEMGPAVAMETIPEECGPPFWTRRSGHRGRYGIHCVGQRGAANHPGAQR